MRPCDYCGRSLENGIVKCPHCGVMIQVQAEYTFKVWDPEHKF